ncbi:MAG TPA: hypothetical protein P5250_05930 [Bacteroidales bacterium]|nr:hypothetical protein [Bacteroidales bacterium]
MKKIKISLLLLSIIAICKAQNPIPNGNFETWSSTGYEYPQYYQYNSIIRSLISNNYYAPNVEKTTDAYHGNYAVKLTTIAASQDTIFGYFLNTPPNEGDVNTWIGGAPINETPTGIRGYYKYNLATIDSATIIVSFSKMGVNIGTYIFKVGGITNSYLPFQFTFNPPLSVAPDSVVFAAVSSNIFSSNNGIPGACLYIDSISLLGITSQPAMLNGDFEYWQNNTLTYPNDWYMNNANEDNYGYISLTTDAAKGNYAIKLESYLEYDFDDVTWYTRPT